MAVAEGTHSPTLTKPRLRVAPPPIGSTIETPQLSVVIVNFCQWRNTARLTRQLRHCEAIRRGAAEIVIVDNHSPTHRSVRKLRKLSGVNIFFNSTNAGFARAVNRGSNISRGDWVLLLNPDVTVPEGFLDEVLEAAQRWPARDPSAGVIGFQLINRDGSPQASAGAFPTFASTLKGLFVPRSRRKCQHLDDVQRSDVPWVTGGCFLVRRDCFEELGGLDEQFFLYYEDVDFCQRARQAGWSVWYEPSLSATHHFPLHSRKVPPPLRLITRHALLTYAQKHWSSWQTKLLAGVIFTEAKARQFLAQRRGDPRASACYDELSKLVQDHLAGRQESIQQRIRQAAAFLDPIASAQDGKTG
jgi:N-acetylglucosaminyl-diphospho-decaprenol L-rhamnosyltransferase